MEAGIRIQFHTRVVSAEVDKTVKLSYAITESKSARQAWAAEVFIDATGDGDLGALAGCGFDIGNPENSETQPMSLIAILGGVDAKRIDRFNRASKTEGVHAKKNLLAEMERAGLKLSYTDPFFAHMGGNLFIFMANHMYGASALDAAQITDATLGARAQIHTIVHGLKKSGNPWINLRVVATAPHIGIREGHRLHE